MLRENQRQCHICQRLGKSQCGYHKFKNEFLSKLDNSNRQNYFTQTQSSIHGKSHATPYSPEKINRRIVNIQYSEPRNLQNQPANYPQPHWQPCPSEIPIPTSYHQQIVQPQSRIVPIEHQIVRIQGNQTLYYPIYPVYEIVYEPVSKDSSFLSPSQVLYN